MSVCRVYEYLDGSVVVHHPAPEGRREGEIEEDWLARVFARAEEAQPNLQGLRFIDVDSVSLPDRKMRSRWRISGSVVVIGSI